MEKGKSRVLHLTTIFPQNRADYRGIFIKRLVFELSAKVNTTVLCPSSPVAMDSEKWLGVHIFRFRYWYPKTKQKIGYGIDTRRNITSSFLSLIQIVPYLISFLYNTYRLGKKVDIFHAHNTFTAIFPIIANYFYWGKKSVITSVLGSDIKFLPAWFNSYVVKHTSIITFGAPLFAASDYALPRKKDLNRIFVDTNTLHKFRELYYPIEESFFNNDIDSIKLKKSLNLEDKFVVSFLGRMDDIKDPMTFIKSIPFVIEYESNIRFFACGFGPLRKDAEEFIVKNDLEEYIVLHEPTKNMNKLFAVSDILCSLDSDTNLWATVLAEAHIMRVPCIISDTGSTSKLYTHEKDCMLLPTSNPKELADAILTLYNNTQLQKSITDNALELLNKHGRRDSDITENYFNLYEEVLGSSGNSS